MWHKAWSIIASGAIAALPTLGIAQDATETKEPHPVIRTLRVVAKQLADGKQVLVAEEVEEKGDASKYWIGIGIGELSDIVREQLGLEHGLVVDNVLPDSPAIKAGFKKNDILVKAGDKPFAQPADLVNAVEEAKESELAIGVLRGGKEMTIKVTPAKRPDQPQFEARSIEVPGAAPGALHEEIKRLEEALKALRGHGGEGAGIVIPRPAFVAPRHVEVIVKHEFPKDLSISVTKEGDQPAKIHVKRGDKEWDVTEDKLGELPEDVRPHVHHFFGGARLHTGGLKVAVPTAVPPALPGAPATPIPTAPVAPPSTARAFAYRLDSRETDQKLGEIMKELKALRKEVDELRGKSSEEK
jgi:hypothetical protein